jgi:hypothetical protein
MKQLTSLFIGSILAFSISAQDMSNAGTYMDYFNEIYEPIQKDMWDYTSSVAKGKKAKKIDKKRVELLQTYAAAESKVSRAKAFEDDASLRDEVEKWLKTCQIILNEDYGKIMDLEELSESSYDNMEAYIKARQLAGDHMEETNANLSSATETFAREHGVKLIESESKLANKLEKAGEVFDYYDEIYLVFFKPYKQEMYLMDAVNSGDVPAIEQNRKMLLDDAVEAQNKLKEMKSLNSDPTLVDAAKEMMAFYKDEAEKEAIVYKEFFMTKERFETVKTSFEALKKKDQTQEAVEEYNGAINDYNAAVEAYNETNNSLNEQREKALNNWNKSVDKFLSKHAI